LTFNPVREVVGFDLYLPMTSETATVTVAFGDNTSSVFPLTDADGNNATPIFWGIISDVPLRQLTTSGNFSSLTGMTTLVDNLATDVPEPMVVAPVVCVATLIVNRWLGRRGWGGKSRIR